MKRATKKQTTFRVWNYGLYGDEETWNIPYKHYNKHGSCLVDFKSFDELRKFIDEYRAKGAYIEYGDGYVGCIQLSTTYSTCGEMGYINPITPGILLAIKDLFER